MANYYSGNLQKGSKGDEVKRWQEYLNSQGYNLTVDGDFGDLTDQATRDYQSKSGLGVDGIVGPNTWGKAGFNNASNAPTPTAAKPFEYDAFAYDAYKESDTVNQALAALNAQNAQKPGAYQSQWNSQLSEVINQILNRDKFSYDLNSDALYQQYADKHMQQGKMAMADAMGQASALTGGYGNSYAQTVGQQQYQAHLENLNDIVPELYQMALDKYNMEGQELYKQYGMLGEQEALDYGKYRDTVADFEAERDYLAGRYDSERSYDYSKYNNERDFAYGQYSDDKSYAYNEHRNAIEDEKWQKEYDEAVRQYNEQMAFQKQQYNDSKVKASTPTYTGKNSAQIAKDKAVDKAKDNKEKDGSTITYDDIRADLGTFIKNGADKSEINNYLRQALKAGYIDNAMYNKLKDLYAPRGYTY